MKISSIHTFKKHTITPAFKGKDDYKNEDFPLDNGAFFLKPEYFQELHGIACPLPPIEISLSQGTSTLSISSTTALKYLKTQDRKTSESLVCKFAEVYTKNLQDRLNSEDEAMKLYAQTLKENSELRKQAGIDTKKLDSASRTAALLLASTNERTKIAKKQAYEETELFFEISKTSKGYDFSKQEEKRQIAGLLHTLQKNSYHTKNLVLELKKAAIDTNGEMDTEFAALICAFIANQDFAVSPLYIADKITYFTGKDPRHKAEIIETMLKLNNTDFQLDDYEPAFENLMEACFTKDGQFIKEAPGIVLKLTDAAEALLNCWLDTDRIDDSNILPYIEFSKTIILGYLENIIDEDGNIDETEIPSKEELQNVIEDLFLE